MATNHNSPPPQAPRQLLRDAAVAARLGISKNTIRNWRSNPERAPTGFPRPVRFGRIVAYEEAEIDRFILASTERHRLRSDPTIAPVHGARTGE